MSPPQSRIEGDDADVGHQIGDDVEAGDQHGNGLDGRLIAAGHGIGEPQT